MAPRGSRIGHRGFHSWLVPEKTTMGLFSLGIILMFIGAILMAVAGTQSARALMTIGAIFFAIGLFMVVFCLFVCVYAYMVWYVRDSETQTSTIITTTPGVDMVDTPFVPTYAVIDKKSPNGVLRDARTPSGTLTKKHVTISPRSTEAPSQGYISGRQSDTSKSSEYSSPRSDYSGSKTSKSSASADRSQDRPQDDKYQLASFAYLNEPYMQTPYSSLGQRKPVQSQAVNIPIHVQPVQSGYGKTASVRPYYSEQMQAPSSQLPVRRHSDEDYDNAGDMSPMLAYQTYTPAKPPVPPQAQWRQVNPSYEEPSAPQPLVYPSARRPMTFEQLSSSKVSIYDNIHMGFKEEVD